MVKSSFKVASLLFILAQCVFSFNAVANVSIDKLLTLSGIIEPIEGFPNMIKSSLEQAKQQGSPIPDAAFQTIMETTDKTIVPATIISDISAKVAKVVNAKDVEKLLLWYQSDVGKEITAAEIAGATPDAFAKMQQQAQQLMRDTKRVEFARKIDKLTGATDKMIELQVQAGTAVYAAMVTTMTPETPLDMAQYKTQITANMVPMRSNMENMVLISLVYAYQNIELEKLNKYHDFMADATTKKFSDAAISGLISGFEKSLGKWAGALVANLKVKSPAKTQ
jgi:hypothetical protein